MLPQHRRPFGERFSVWRRFCLRSAGFAAETALRVAEPASARAADALLEERLAATAARDRAIARCERWLSLGDEERRGDAIRCMKVLRAGRLPSTQPSDADTAAALESLTEAERKVSVAHERLEAEMLESRAQVKQFLASFAMNDRLRRAVAWQNRALLATALDRYTAQGDGTDKKTRQREQLIVSYVQRFSLKNESVGFFGPVAWGTWRDDDVSSLTVGERINRRPAARLERWAAQEVANAMARLAGAESWLHPRRSPLLRVSGAMVDGPFGSFSIPEPETRVLAACDGRRTARDIAVAMSEAGVVPSATEGILRGLVDKQFVRWALDLPTHADRYEDALAAWIASVGDASIRQTAQGWLDDLTAGVRRCEDADCARALCDALEDLERRFTTITAAEATHSPGAMHAGRTLVTSMAARDAEIAAGADVLRALAGPLGLLGTAARWWSAEIARVTGPKVLAIVRAARAGVQPVELTLVWGEIAKLFPRTDGEWFPEAMAVTAQLQDAWARILDVRSDARRIEVSAADVRAMVAEAFPADGPGWPAARCHSPDVMAVASSFEAIARGECKYVLGEAHFFVNSLEQGVFVREHPDREELARSLREDHPRGRLVPAAFEGGVGSTFADHPGDRVIQHDWTLPWQPPDRVIPICELVAVEIDDAIYFETKDGRRRWSVASGLDGLLSSIGLKMFHVTKRSPRITIDDVIVARETWRFAREELDFASEVDAAARFVAARDFAGRHGMPRHCFYRACNELKPCFVDFESPLLVDALAKAARGAAEIVISEMLPGPSDCWLKDRSGAAYTAEIRMVLVDDLPYVPARHER